jgi:hypothetical protein
MLQFILRRRIIMSRKSLFLIFLVLLVGLAANSASAVDPDLIGWWKLDEGAGTICKDSSGLGNDGKFGTPGNPKWVAGKFGGGVYLDGNYSHINIDAVAKSMPTNNNITISAWINTTATVEGNVIGGNESGGGHDFIFGMSSTGQLLIEADSARYYGSGLNNGQWHMITYVRSGTTATLYIDGVQVGTETPSGDPHREVQWSIGQEWDTNPSDEFVGTVDDVRFYKRALTVAEIQQVMKGESNKAEGPSPTDKATDVPRDAMLSWRALPSAGTHDVYFGTVLADVNTASRMDAKGVLAKQGQADTTYDPAGVFAYGQTYYWRIDEVNKTPDNTIFKGDTWSFTAEPYGYPVIPIKATASSSQPNMGPEKTIDGSGLTGDLHGVDSGTMWMSAGVQPNWIQYEFDKVYKLYQLLVWNSNQMVEAFMGFGAKTVKIETSTDGTTWKELADVPEFGRGSGLAGYAANTTVNFAGAQAKFVKLTILASWGGMAPQTGLSEVRFSYVPVQARAPEPATAATGVSIETGLNWRPGREAASHKVFFGTDANAVAQGTVAAKTVTEHSSTPGTLNLGTTYYWRVDEVNAVTYPGDVWSFTTQDSLVVEDFESYTDKAGEEIFSAWIDGYTSGTNGSTVGAMTATNGTFGETTIKHGGKQSMPLAYDNTKAPSYSEAVRTFGSPQNWTVSGVKSLSLWFWGTPGNGGQLYLKINNTKVAYNGAAGDLAKPVWMVWNIDLSKTGASLSKVTSLTIGIEGAGSQGTLYIDDICLYPGTPQSVTPVDPGKTNLVGLWTLDGNANDTSGKGNNGTLNGPGTWVAGQIGQALQFNGTSVSVDCGKGASLNLTDALTITAWIKMDFTGADRKIAGNQDNTTGGYKLGVYSNNFVELEIRTSANASRTTRSATAGGTALQQDVWYFVAGTFAKGPSGQTLQTYVFGNPDRALGTSQLLGTSTGSFQIGKEPFGTSGYWLGALDDVRVYNKVLSQEELLWVMGQTTPVAEPF